MLTRASRDKLKKSFFVFEGKLKIYHKDTLMHTALVVALRWILKNFVAKNSSIFRKMIQNICLSNHKGKCNRLWFLLRWIRYFHWIPHRETKRIRIWFENCNKETLETIQKVFNSLKQNSSTRCHWVANLLQMGFIEIGLADNDGIFLKSGLATTHEWMWRTIKVTCDFSIFRTETRRNFMRPSLKNFMIRLNMEIIYESANYGCTVTIQKHFVIDLQRWLR